MKDQISRVFLIVLDSAGCGELPDAAEYGDVGSNTFKALYDSGKLNIPTMTKLGFYNIDGIEYGKSVKDPEGSYARLAELSKGKDTTVGHWEIAGVVSQKALPTYPDGFPQDLLDEYSRRTGRGNLCNKPYSGTEVLKDYGKEHEETGDLIIYTSADSVFQVAANEAIVPVEELYQDCEVARKLLQGEHGVGRVIARPFVGEYPDYTRTSNRHDYAIAPPQKTMLDLLKAVNLDTIGIGKIYDIFAGKGVQETTRTKNNADGMAQTDKLLEEEFTGLAFINLVDFDMVYGHRNNVEGYTNAMNEFDAWLAEFYTKLNEDDLLLITADHGCDPATPSTDHSREYIPLLVYGKNIKKGVNLGTRTTFGDIAATILDIFDVPSTITGTSFKDLII